MWLVYVAGLCGWFHLASEIDSDSFILINCPLSQIANLYVCWTMTREEQLLTFRCSKEEWVVGYSRDKLQK